MLHKKTVATATEGGGWCGETGLLLTTRSRNSRQGGRWFPSFRSMGTLFKSQRPS